MRLYVWNNPYKVSYGGSCLYAIAESEEQAREIAVTAITKSYGEYNGQMLGDHVKLGAPTRSCDLPYAEVYEWSD